MADGNSDKPKDDPEDGANMPTNEPDTQEEWSRIRKTGSILLIAPFIVFFLLIAIWPIGYIDGKSVVDDKPRVAAQPAATPAVTSAPKPKLPTGSDGATTNQSINEAPPPDPTAIPPKKPDESATTGTGTTPPPNEIKKTATQSAPANNAGKVQTFLFGPIHIEISLMLVVLLSGALGSIVFTARSFALHLGRQDFGMSWLWWYAMRIPIGMSLALMLYFVLRGGLFAGTFASPEIAKQTVNPFGFAGIATLAGMFSRQVSDKLSEIFEIMFKTETDQGSGAVKTPQITDLVPNSIKAGTTDPTKLSVLIKGKNFSNSSMVLVGASQRKPSDTNATSLIFDLIAGDVAKAGSLKIMVAESKNKKLISNEKILPVKA